MSTKHSSYRTQRREKRAAKRRQQQTYLIAALVVVLVLILLGAYRILSRPAAAVSATPTASASGMITTASGLQYQDTKVGTGAEAKKGNTVTVHYVGTLADGTKFDSSRDKNQPFTFILGAGQVIPGWDEGVAGMKVGGIRKLVIPPAIGYGSQANGAIPANSTLYFEVELLTVK